MPRPETIDPTAIYGVTDVAELMHCDRRVVYRAINEGELRSFIPSGCTRGSRILGQWVVEWMERGPAR